MANVAISGLPVTTSMTDSSILPVVVSGTTYQISGADLKTYIGAATAGGSMNYAQTLGSQMTTNSTGVLVTVVITTTGAPVLISAVGDANPQGGSAWCRLQLFRDSSPIGGIVQAENASNVNAPYCVEFIDNPAAGTYTYTLQIVSISGSIQFGEASGPTIYALELTSGSGSAAGGGDTQVQFNDAGTLAGDAVLTFDKTTGLLSSNSITATDTVSAQTVMSENVYIQSAIIATTYVGIASIVTTGQIDVSQGGYFAVDVGSVPVTLDVVNYMVGPGPFVVKFILEIKDGGTNVTWWPGITWPGGTPPVLSTTGTDVLEFYYVMSGEWRGFVLGLDMK